MNETSDQFKRDFDRILMESGSCPSTEKLQRFLGNELPTITAQRMEFHLFDCPHCSDLMHSLEEDAGLQLESDLDYLKQRDKQMDRTAAVLGLQTQSQSTPHSGFFNLLWTIRMPAVIPPAVIAVCLAFLIPAYYGGPDEQSISFHDIPKLTADLRTSRSAENGEIVVMMEAGQTTDLSLKLDSAKLRWDDTTPIECHFIDPSGHKTIHRADVETDSFGIFYITLGIRLSLPGVWTVELVQEGADKPFDTIDIKVMVAVPK